MGILYKIIAGINKTEPIFVEREGLLSFPEKLEEVSDYLVFLNHIMTNGIVTKTDDLQKQKNKLQFIINNYVIRLYKDTIIVIMIIIQFII